MLMIMISTVDLHQEYDYDDLRPYFVTVFVDAFCNLTMRRILMFFLFVVVDFDFVRMIKELYYLLLSLSPWSICCLLGFNFNSKQVTSVVACQQQEKQQQLTRAIRIALLFAIR